MCVIIYRPAEHKLSLTTLDNCMDDNPDGWGLMWSENGQVVVRKGREMRDFWPAYREAGVRDLGIHFRFRTHGSVSDDQAHPYVVFNGNQRHQPLWLMHNGVFNHVKMHDETRSDTEHWIEQILRPILGPEPELWGNETFWDMIKEDTRGSRLLMLNGRGEWAFTGQWEQHEGCHFSNTYSVYGSWKSGMGGWGGHYNKWNDEPYDRLGSTSARTTAVAYAAKRAALLAAEDQEVCLSFDNMDPTELVNLSWGQLQEACNADPDGAAEMIWALIHENR